ncbi:general substrate transporter [Echria macrotheca]|uniref:General substrate transporter n=1 Tax=Echria macrotheca TaxID=438768 RepID=A0AAJ0B639_9PEZI|nr:general substrate transporter [Echria macrotheca]
MSPTTRLEGATLVALITSVCSAGFLLFGYDQGVMSGVVISPSWLAAMGRPSDLEIGTITAIYNVGAVAGAILASIFGETLGRKRTLLLGAALVCVGGLGMGLAPDRMWFMATRVVVGVGIGFTTSVTPVYQAEVSAHAQRGWQVCCQLTTMLVGLLLAYCINYGWYFHPGAAQWRVPLAFQCVFATYILALTPFLPDTPRWLASHHAEDDDSGLRVLARLRGRSEDDATVRKEMDEIRGALAAESKAHGTWGDLFRSNGVSADKRFYLAVGIQFMQQMSGINIITYFAPLLFRTALGMGQEDALLLGCFTQLWYVLASFVTWYTIDRVGRRKLLITMAVGMGLVLVGEAVSTAAGTRAGAIAAVVFLFLFEACFTWGWMACVWIYPPEILPLKIRAKGSALAAAADFIGNWVVVEVTPVGITKMGWRFYLVWAGFNLINAVIVWLFYPETGGLMLETMDHVFTKEIDTETVTLVHRLQWSRVRVAAEAVQAAKAGTTPRSDAERGLLEEASDTETETGRQS